MTMGAVTLAADSTLNSYGNDITMTSIDGETESAHNLVFSTGIGSTGTVTIGGAVGANYPVGTVTVNSLGTVIFSSSFQGEGIVTASGTTTVFNGGTTTKADLNGISTTGASSLGGTVSLVNTLQSIDDCDVDPIFKISSSGTFAMPGKVTLSGGPFEMTGNGGSFTQGVAGTGTLTGSQLLTLSGTTTKNFNGTLNIGNGTTAIQNATGGSVTFSGQSTLSGASTFSAPVVLANGGQLSVAGSTTLTGGLSLGAGSGTLGGAGVYNINTVSGVGRTLTYPAPK
ncbi:MAG: hypothetical protein EBU81_10465 [Proteobacteria bacterium]|nr:hypothetical protein [Pseudomonadota bacterium]